MYLAIWTDGVYKSLGLVLCIISPLLAKCRADQSDSGGKPECPDENHRLVVIKV